MIKLLVIDVDGTLTDGKIIYSYTKDDHQEVLKESKEFDVKDGLAIAVWTKKLGLKAAIITGRKSKVVEHRAKELGITHLYQGIDNKLEVLEDIISKEGILYTEVAGIGDDLNDYQMLNRVGLSFCPNDASEYIQEIVDIVCKNKGGSGAVREMIEYICKQYNLEEQFLKAWL
ncbi:KdsC family phosphatase [Arcobacter sp. FWKO B]|uniref:KdsC family phosphatase n=1 Tax=Arcobacter sp. FWKO B TaxID=2593672 RepID=UPI0018A49594|nr:HAD hydrolase family protein [Arcobacter sp. FWKO B]QOG12983.1 HAD family hydrolase [Arcobacter sp. FWKO B]